MRLPTVIRPFSRPIISNAQRKPAILTRTLDAYGPAFRPDGNGMAHGIFGERLYREWRNVEVERRRVNLQIHVQPVLITELFEREVLTREIVLLGEFNELAAIFL